MIRRRGTELPMAGRLHLDLDRLPFQHIPSPSIEEGYEGVAFSSTGDLIAAAAAEANAVLLFRRKSGGRFEDAPCCMLNDLGYPHDVSFGKLGDREVLAIAQRISGISFYLVGAAAGQVKLEPMFEIGGSDSGIEHPDAVAFVPPDSAHVAACNLYAGTVCFYRRTSLRPVRYDSRPDFVLKHNSIFHPDGLAFSSSGRWLALANHGDASVAIFRRNRQPGFSGMLTYGPDPVSVIRDESLRYPHSLAFTPKTSQLIVSNAGASHVSIFAPQSTYWPSRWSSQAVAHGLIAEDEGFVDTNSENPMEGGPKGVATFQNQLAICGRQLGIKLYRFRETGYFWKGKRRDYPIPVSAVPELGAGTTVDFTKSGNGRPYFCGGWSHPEDWGTWTVGARASLVFGLIEPPNGMKLQLLALGFEPVAGQPQVATVLIDGRRMSVVSLGPEARWIELDLPDIPAAGRHKKYHLDFEIGAPTSPADRGLNEDYRQLGIGVIRLRLVAPTSAIEGSPVKP